MTDIAGIDDKTYYSWHEYQRLKAEFNHIYDIVNEFDDINNFSASKPIDETEKPRFSSWCLNVKQYLKHINTYASCNKKECCRYINYIINKDVRDYFFKDDNSIFDYLKEFIKDGTDPKISNKCITDIDHMDEKQFEETDKLYDLYDTYFSFESSHILSNQSELCEHFTDIVQKFNELINNYKQIYSEHLFNKLYDLKCLIEKHDLVSKVACQKGITDLLSPQPYSSHTSERCNSLEKELKAAGLSVGYPHTSLVFPNEECDHSSEDFHFSCTKAIPDEDEPLVGPKALEHYIGPGTEGPRLAPTEDTQFGKEQRADGNLETEDPRSGSVEERKSAEPPELPGKRASAGLDVAGPDVSYEPAERVRSTYRGGDELTVQDDRITNPTENPSESILNKNVSTIGATLAGSSLFLVMMYKVNKHILSKYYHFV
ncbi:hypothetical protein PVBG_06115 [Plasmodium vivax Brazil I]|uniref:Variable surface protein Vir24 n=1 Tax=Plasmodium vivax (strain Brazil I) TaxID=1033975 RepID=A0A0J9VLL6_PLAV1|nr:hypothetical protein PVBG_06115 [Plasmodium vivax Brazil I]